jgi:hypothetical protein
MQTDEETMRSHGAHVDGCRSTNGHMQKFTTTAAYERRGGYARSDALYAGLDQRMHNVGDVIPHRSSAVDDIIEVLLWTV